LWDLDWLLVESSDTAGRRVGGERLIGEGMELADSAAAAEVCPVALAVNQREQR
jgi:hypothetical protein